MGSYLSTQSEAITSNVHRSPEEILNEQVKRTEEYFKNQEGGNTDRDGKSISVAENTDKSKHNPEQYFLETNESWEDLVDQYMKFHDDHKKIGKVLILMQTGNFYGMYATEKKGPNLCNISKILNMPISFKTIKGNKVYMINLQVSSGLFDTYLDTLLDDGYMVIIVKQYGKVCGNPPILNRKVASTYGPQSMRKTKTGESQNDKNDNNGDMICISTSKKGSLPTRDHISNLFVKLPDNRTITLLNMFGSDTIQDLKEKISKSSKIPTQNFYLIYHGRMLAREDAMLLDYEITTDTTVQARVRNSSS